MIKATYFTIVKALASIAQLVKFIFGKKISFEN